MSQLYSPSQHDDIPLSVEWKSIHLYGQTYLKPQNITLPRYAQLPVIFSNEKGSNIDVDNYKKTHHQAGHQPHHRAPKSSKQSQRPQEVKSHPHENENDVGGESLDDDNVEYDDIQTSLNGEEYILNLPTHIIASSFYPLIIGKNRQTLSKLTKDTETHIHIPSKNAPASDQHGIVIKGKSKRNVNTARNEIYALIFSVTGQTPAYNMTANQSTSAAASSSALPQAVGSYTHFLSLPLTLFTPQFLQFKEKVCADPHVTASAGFTPSLFIPHNTTNQVSSLHITLFMLSFSSSPLLIQQAAKLLQSLHATIYDLLGTTCLVLKLQSIDIMNDDPSDTHVVFAKLVKDASFQKLEKICKLFIEKFWESGLLTLTEIEKQHLLSFPLSVQEKLQAVSASSASTATYNIHEIVQASQVNIKFHATLLNSKHAQISDAATASSSASSSSSSSSRIAFDATQLLKHYHSFDFGQARIPSVHLSARKMDPKTQYYLPETVLNLP